MDLAEAPPADSPRVTLKDPRVWQLLLGSDAHPSRCRAIAEDLSQSLLAPEDAVRCHPLLKPAERKRLESVDMKPLARALEKGVRLMFEEEYPERVRQSEVGPALFVHGDASTLRLPAVGIVGTRLATAYGKACAMKFAEALAKAGVVIVSGGALGIDAAAHRGALHAGGKTIAVLAGGVDHVYPAVHGPLFRDIAQNGMLVSAYANGTRPYESRFLARNGIIAAFSDALIVIQAPVRSGSLSTAHAMADLGREVFVTPANIDSHDFRGSFNLIRDGATLVYHPDQILESLHLKPSAPEHRVAASATGNKILDQLTAEPISVELVVERTGISPGDVLAELTMLELDGLVFRAEGGFAVKP